MTTFKGNGIAWVNYYNNVTALEKFINFQEFPVKMRLYQPRSQSSSAKYQLWRDPTSSAGKFAYRVRFQASLSHNFLKPEWIHSLQITIRRKSSILPNICHHKLQYFELLVPEIKCRYTTADLCAQMYANMLNKSDKTKTTVSGRRARWARRNTNIHVSNMKRGTQHSSFCHVRVIVRIVQ